ncbi:hypothetical protein [Streptomyces chartreusis]
MREFVPVLVERRARIILHESAG